jgi:hypothetical protein
VLTLVMMMIFLNMVEKCGKLAQAYVDMYMEKAPPRTSQLSGMGWPMETIKTHGE